MGGACLPAFGQDQADVDTQPPLMRLALVASTNTAGQPLSHNQEALSESQWILTTKPRIEPSIRPWMPLESQICITSTDQRGSQEKEIILNLYSFNRKHVVNWNEKGHLIVKCYLIAVHYKKIEGGVERERGALQRMLSLKGQQRAELFFS